MSAATHPGTYGFCGQKDAATQTKKTPPAFYCEQELGLEYGPVNYFMMCGPKYANDLGEIVQ